MWRSMLFAREEEGACDLRAGRPVLWLIPWLPAPSVPSLDERPEAGAAIAAPASSETLEDAPISGSGCNRS
jgi:hypothetical protein